MPVPPARTPFVCTLPVRATDFGPSLHMDNVSFQEFVQESREAFLRERGFVYGTEGVHGLLVRTMTLDYLLAVPFGVREVEVDVAVTRIGRTSFALAHRMRVGGMGEVFTAAATLVCVGVDERPVPIGQSLGAALDSALVRGEERV